MQKALFNICLLIEWVNIVTGLHFSLGVCTNYLVRFKLKTQHMLHGFTDTAVPFVKVLYPSHHPNLLHISLSLSLHKATSPDLF